MCSFAIKIFRNSFLFPLVPKFWWGIGKFSKWYFVSKFFVIISVCSYNNELREVANFVGDGLCVFTPSIFVFEHFRGTFCCGIFRDVLGGFRDYFRTTRSCTVAGTIRVCLLCYFCARIFLRSTRVIPCTFPAR